MMQPSLLHRQAPPRLLLVYPATHRLGWAKYFQLPSLSLQQVAAVTPPHWEVTLVDESQDPVPCGRSFDLVGITAMTHQAPRAYEIADQFRSEGVPVIMGGMHPTVMPDEALAHADAVVIGEAESVMAKLLDDFLGNRLEKVYCAPIPQDDRLVVPWPRREILAGKRYLTTQTVQASRGCPYDCVFCTVTHYFGNRFRYRDTADILAELRSFPRKLVIFLDDNFLGDPKKARPILEGMAEMGIRWGSQTSLRFAEDPDLLKLVARSGCIGLFVGIESVTGPYSLLSKSAGLSLQSDLMKRVRDAGIILETSFIFGFDDHDQSIFEKTLRFVEECSPSVPTFNLLTPYPGTELFRQYEQEGRLLHRDWNRYNHSEVVFRPKRMSPEELYRGWVEARKEAYTWPSILSRVWKNPGRRFTNLAYNLLRKGPNDSLTAPGAEECTCDQQSGTIVRNAAATEHCQESRHADSKAVNRGFYDALWSESHLERPERFNTWGLVSGLLPLAPTRLEIGPGLRPRLPIDGTWFLDISPPVIRCLTTRGGIAVSGEVSALPFSDGKFELVCAFDVIEHVEDDRQVFGEASRVLKEGGVFIFSIPLHAGLWTKFDEAVGHVRRYEPADLPELLDAHGLVLERSAAYGMQPANCRLLDVSLWWLKHRRREAMWWYNKVLMPLGMFFQKRLNFVDGLVDAAGVDEIVMVCRKRSVALP